MLVFLGGAGVRRLVGHVGHVIFNSHGFFCLEEPYFFVGVGTGVGSLIPIKKEENSFNNFTSKYGQIVYLHQKAPP